MGSRYQEYCVLKYGNQYISDLRLSGGHRKDIVGFSLVDKERDAEVFWKDSSYDRVCVNKLILAKIGVTQKTKIKYLTEITIT